jgi:hypothetical protein
VTQHNVHQFHTRCRTIPCVLCGTIHPGHIHGYVERKYRDREHQENVTIIIPVIICPGTRVRGIQYTKRLLPDFLVPRSVIRLDHLMEAAALPTKEQTTDRVCEILGCIDPRTARSGISGLNNAIRRVSLDLAYRRSATPELGTLPASTPDTSPFDHLSVLYQAEQGGQQRAGRDAAPLPLLVEFLQAAMWHHPGNGPSGCVSHPEYPP